MRRRIQLRLGVLAALAALICLLALLAPCLTAHDPYATNPKNAFAPPSFVHWLGTDELGRDEFSRLLCGLGPSLGAALSVVGVSALLGSTLGILGGYFSGPIDWAVQWFITTFQAFPSFLLALVIAGFLGNSLTNACLALIAAYWTSIARLARSLVLSARQQPYLDGAILSGCTRAQLLGKHILPNILPQLALNAAAQVGSVIISLAGLCFLGLGAQRPTCAWGVMLNEAQKLLRQAPQLLLYASVSLVTLALVFNLLGDALRDACDTRIETTH